MRRQQLVYVAFKHYDTTCNFCEVILWQKMISLASALQSEQIEIDLFDNMSLIQDESIICFA